MSAAPFDTLEAAVATGGRIGEVRGEIGAVKAEFRAVRRVLGFMFAIVLAIASRQFGGVCSLQWRYDGANPGERGRRFD